ncbi:MAG: GntR family transcriptional regulator [Actinobacteria bacterium]|nr:GntR family transcriptional regulator [Actinomycetota bacterium]
MTGVRLGKPYAVRELLESLCLDLPTGAALPPERELAIRFGVARETVRAALAQLQLEGRLVRLGRSTVIAGGKITQPLRLGSYTEAMREYGIKPGREVIGCTRSRADASLAADLGITRQDQVIHLERVLLADDERIGLESTYLAARRFPQFETQFDGTSSFYAFLHDRDIVLTEAREDIETASALPREATLLGIRAGAPMLLLRRRSLDQAGDPVEVVRSVFRGDRLRLTTVLR